LNCRGSRPHLRMTHQEGVVSLTIRILLSTVISHFCKGLSISLPCHKNGGAQTWLAYISAGIAYVLRSHMQMCNLFVRSCSCMNCLMRKVPAVNGRSAASAAVFKLICLSQTMPRYLKECVGELRPTIKERGQIAGVRFEAHHLRLLCINSERLSSCIRSPDY